MLVSADSSIQMRMAGRQHSFLKMLVTTRPIGGDDEKTDWKLEFGGSAGYARKIAMRSLLQMGLLALVGFLFSCSSKKEAPTASEGAGRILALDPASGEAALQDKFADFSKDIVLDKNGRVMKDSKRSSLEGRQFTNIGGDYGSKKFAASRYSKSEWAGSKNFDPGKFNSTKNRWDDQEWFVKQHAQEAGLTARNQGEAYSTAGYKTANAREQGGERFQKSSNVQTDIRRRVFKGPDIIQKGEYERMTIEESKNILGR